MLIVAFGALYGVAIQNSTAVLVNACDEHSDRRRAVLFVFLPVTLAAE